MLRALFEFYIEFWIYCSLLWLPWRTKLCIVGGISIQHHLLGRILCIEELGLRLNEDLFQTHATLMSFNLETWINDLKNQQVCWKSLLRNISSSLELTCLTLLLKVQPWVDVFFPAFPTVGFFGSTVEDFTPQISPLRPWHRIRRTGWVV